MQSSPYDNPALARQPHQMQMAQQQQQQPAQPQYNRPPPVGNVRLKQDFAQFKGTFTNVVKQIASDLLTGAEAMSGAAVDDSKRSPQHSTEKLLNDFDAAYTQLEYNLSLLHRSYLRQQQVLQQNQSAALLSSSNQPQQLGVDGQGAGSLRNIVDKLSELLKPPVHLKSASTAEVLRLQQQQRLQNQASTSEKSQLLNPPSNESSNHSNLIAAPNSFQQHHESRVPSKASSKASSKSSSSASPASRTSPTDPMSLNQQLISNENAGAVDMLSTQPQSSFPMEIQQEKIPPPQQQQQQQQAQQQRKHLIDYGDSDSGSDDDRNHGRHSPDADNLAKIAIDVGSSHEMPTNIDEASCLSLHVPEQEEANMESKPTLTEVDMGGVGTVSSLSTGHIVTNEDSMGSGWIFSAESASQIKVESTLPFEGEEEMVKADSNSVALAAHPDGFVHGQTEEEEEDLLSPAGGETKPMYLPHSNDVHHEHFDD